MDNSLLVEQVIKTVLDSFKIGQVTLVGLSLGTMCALDFTLAYPQQVSRLILASPGLDILSSVISVDALSKKMFSRSDSIGETKNAQAMANDFMESWCVGPFRKDDQVKPAIRTYVYRTTLLNMRKQPHVWPRFNFDHSPADVDGIKCPMLVIHGDRDIPYITAVAAYLRAHHDAARVYTMQGVAHMLNMEQPALFDRIVREFLEK